MHITFFEIWPKYSFDQIRINAYFHGIKNVDTLAMCLCHYVKSIAHTLWTISFKWVGRSVHVSRIYWSSSHGQFLHNWVCIYLGKFGVSENLIYSLTEHIPPICGQWLWRMLLSYIENLTNLLRRRAFEPQPILKLVIWPHHPPCPSY